MSAKSKRHSADAIPLVSPNTFKEALKKVLSNTKRDSDKQLAELQAANVRKRQERKRR